MLQGTLSQGVLPGILRELYVGRKTGLLYFINGDERRGVRFRRGHIVRADTNVKDERLGETLVRLGMLSQVDLDRATELVVREKKRLGIVLQELGVMDKEQIEEALSVHVREILLKVFSWGEGSYAFEDQDPEAPVDEDVTLRLSTGEMILEAVRRVEDPDVVRFALGDIDRILGLSTDPLLRFQRITLTPTDGYVLSRIDGTLSAREVIQMIPVSPEEATLSLFGLLCTGVVEYLAVPPKSPPKAASGRGRPAAAAARPLPPSAPSAAPAAPPAPAAAAQAPLVAHASAAPGGAGAELPPEATSRRHEILDVHGNLKAKNHFDVLGIPKTSNDAQVKEAYFRLARKFHPDVHHDPALADLKDTLESIFIRLGEAYEVLRNPRSRAGYESDLTARAPRTPPPASARPPSPEPAAPADPALEARAVEIAVKTAEKRFVEEKYWDVIQLLEPVVAGVPSKVKNRGRVLLARAYAKNPNWIKRGEEALLAVIQDDAANVDAYFALGQIYKSGGLRSRAASMLRKVLELRPEHEQAAAALAEVAPELSSSAPEGGGLLKKLFGKS